MQAARRNFLACCGGLLIAVVGVYSNHFGNGFHFDDIPTIVENPAIRTLADVPRFFIDVGTFSPTPGAQSYRPLVTASLALDYALAGSLTPFWFHFSTFLWFVVQLLLMYALYMFVLERCSPHPQNRWVALFATAIYGLHPVSAETVNYIIQRGDLYVALGIVAAIVVYAWKPSWRRYGFYLIPALLAMFAKPTAIVFALFLLAYILLIDRGTAKDRPIEPVSHCALRSVPAFALSLAFLGLQKWITPPTFFHTTIGTYDYLITQPYVTLRYFRTFFLPFYLNVDTDLRPLHSVMEPKALAGAVFCVLLLWVAVFTSRRRQWLPVSFGLWWFFIGLIPTAVYPLNEVENDHRMFLPFVGLTLAVVWTAALLLRRSAAITNRAIVTAGVLLLAGLAWGTHQRNQVWRTDESLWRDDVEKSPANPRGHDHLCAALSKRSDRLEEAIAECRTALQLKPDFANAHVNLGKVLLRIPDRLPEAVQELESAVALDPKSADAHVNLGAALVTSGRYPEAIQHLQTALQISPDFVEAHFNLAGVLSKIPGRERDAIAEYQATLRLKPDYTDAHTNLGLLLATFPDRLPEAVQEFDTVLKATPDVADAHLNRGAALSRMPGRMPEAIVEYQTALRLKPDFPEARANLERAQAERFARSSNSLSDLEALVRANPDSADAHYYLGLALSKLPDGLPASIEQFQTAARLRPDYADAHTMLGISFSKMPAHLQEAIREFREAERCKPNSAESHSNLALALSLTPGGVPEAIAEFEASLKIKPDPAIQQTVTRLRAGRGR